jgi:transposase
VKKSASQYRALLATVRPRDLAGKTCRRMAAEELEDTGRLDVKLKAMKAELKAAVLATGSHLMDIHGIGPAGAARILADVGDVTRFPDRGHFASWNGTAPIDASSGQHTRHRLSRAGNRRINHVLYIAGIVQLRNDTPGRAYYRGKLQQSKTSMEAMRCLRRRLSDAVYRQLVTDAAARLAAQQASPEEPSPASLPSGPAGLETPAAPVAATSRRRDRGVNVERPTGRTTLTPTSAGVRSTASGSRT